MPIKNIDCPFRADFDTKTNPGKVISRQKILTVLPNKTRAFRHHVVSQYTVLVNVTHEELVSVFCRERISKVKTRASVSRLVCMIPDCLDVIINKTVHVLSALLVINPSLNDMKQVGNYAAGGKTLPMIVEIKAPRIG